MKDKEMIEEMVSIIFRTEFIDISYYEAGKIAEELLKYYQPKLPEGSVVLSKEEYTKDFCSQFNKGYERGSKETAKEIYKLVDNKLDLYRKGVIGSSLHDDGYKTAIYDVKRTIKELFGVEVEE